MNTLCILVASLCCLVAEPSTQPAGSYPALQKRLAELLAMVDALRAENATLKSENQRLATELADLKATAVAAPGAKNSKRDADGRSEALAVGWQGPIGKARVRTYGQNYILLLLTKDGREFGTIMVGESLGPRQWADDQLIEDPIEVKVNGRVRVEGEVYLFADPVERQTPLPSGGGRKTR